MPAKLVLDTIQGAEAELAATNARIVRTGTVTEIDATAAPDASVIFAALAAEGMPTLGASVYPGTTLVFIRLLIRGFTTNGVMVALYYETFQGIIPSAYIIRDHSSMTSRTMTFDKFTNRLLEVSYKGSPGQGLDTRDPTASSGSSSPIQSMGTSPGHAIPVLDRVLCPTEVLMPCREISITKVSVGHPNIPGRDSFAGVNDNDWPGKTDSPFETGGIPGFQDLWKTPAPVGNPLPAGYWLLNRIDTDWTRYLNYFTMEISAISLVNMPWSQILVGRDPSGLYVRPDPTVLSNALKKHIEGYTEGLVSYDDDGFAIWGPYPMVDFKAAFGF